MNHQYEEYYWAGIRGSEQREIIVAEFRDGDPLSEKARANYPRMAHRVRQAWELRSSPRLFSAEDWKNYNDWRGLIGSRLGGFQPTTVFQLSINGCPFFSECFHLGTSVEKCTDRAKSIGAWMAFVFEKLPPVGEEYGGVRIRDPHGEDSQIFWLGVILQGRRATYHN